MEVLRFIAGTALCFTLFKALRVLEAQSRLAAVVCGFSILMGCFGLMNWAWTTLWDEPLLRPIMHAQTVIMLVAGFGGIIYSIVIAYSAYRQKQ